MARTAPLPLLSFRSVIASFLIVGGALLSVALLHATIGFTRAIPLDVAFGIGAALGGLITGIASRGRTVIEPTIGGGLVVASLTLIWATRGHTLYLLKQAGSPGNALYTFGALAIVACLVGAVAGERLARPSWRAAPIFWRVVSYFVAMGMVMTIILLDLVLLDYLPSAPEGMGILVLLVAGAVATGAVTQSLAPAEIVEEAASGILSATVIVALAALLASAESGDRAGSFVIIIVLGFLGQYIARFGASAAWRRFPQPGESLPTAQVRDDSD